jgi:hypothetical protein
MALPNGAGIPRPFIRTYRVLAANTVRQGMSVVFSGTDVVEAATDDQLIIGIAYGAPGGVWPVPALGQVDVVLLGSPCACLVRSTAAGLTAGSYCCAGAAGAVNVVIGGAVLCNVIGQVLQTATAAGELVEVNLGTAGPTVTAA